MERPVPVELRIPDQERLESTETMVGQSECPEAADVSELCEEKQHQVNVNTFPEIQ